MTKTELGLIGLGVMGENLALNLARNEYQVVVYNRTYQKVRDFLEHQGKHKNISGVKTIQELCHSIKKPRVILLLIKTGQPIDTMIKKLVPYLDEEDILIDGGNSFFKDSIRRLHFLANKNIRFLGVGISGGAEGALKGPSIMPGGDTSAWLEVKDMLQNISATVMDQPCCEYLGTDGAGHYVKMVHNGIEYAIMQAIAESYQILTDIFTLQSKELVSIYESWNAGELGSYLLEITANIFKAEDPQTHKPVIEVILDVAKQKGTGNWTAQNALELGVPSTSITQAVFARIISANKKLRIKCSQVRKKREQEHIEPSQERIENLRKTLYCSLVCAYSQGFAQLLAAKQEYGWHYSLVDISQIWQQGCIIRAQLLKPIRKTFQDQPTLENLLLHPTFQKRLHDYQNAWRSVNCLAIDHGIPTPVFSSSLIYYDSLGTERLPANLIQAQRDYFGAHTFRRIDQDREKSFHHEWK